MPLRPLRRRFGLIGVIVLAVSIGGGWFWSRVAVTESTMLLTTPGETPYPNLNTNDNVEGMGLPAVELQLIDGRTVATASFIGSPMIINFWYSTCEPCRREMPVLARAHSKHGSTIAFLGLNMNDSPAVAQAFATKYKVEFDIAFDPSGSFISKLGVATAPTTLFVNAAGVVVDQVAGELSQEKLDDLIAQWFTS
jgi:peroxiredoxin